jgi:hypothetical protein
LTTVLNIMAPFTLYCNKLKKSLFNFHFLLSGWIWIEEQRRQLLSQPVNLALADPELRAPTFIRSAPLVERKSRSSFTINKISKKQKQKQKSEKENRENIHFLHENNYYLCCCRTKWRFSRVLFGKQNKNIFLSCRYHGSVWEKKVCPPPPNPPRPKHICARNEQRSLKKIWTFLIWSWIKEKKLINN